MTEIFDKNRFILTDLSGKAKREHIFYIVLSAVLFLLSVPLMWEFSYDLCNILGAIVCLTPAQAGVQLVRVLPLSLAAFFTVALSAFVHRIYTADSIERRARGWERLSVTAAALGLILILYVGVRYLTGGYELVEGNPTPLFPLDMLIYGCLLSLFGGFAAIYAKTAGEEMPATTEKRPNAVRFGGTVFSSALTAVAVGGTVTGLFTVDFTHGYIFFNIALLLSYALPGVFFLCYRYIYYETKAEYRKDTERKLAAVLLLLGVLTTALYMIAVEVQNEAPNQNAFGILPIEFSASFHAYPLIYGTHNIVVPLVAFLHSFRKDA